MPRPEAIEDFKKRLRGSLLAPADPNYDVARRVWNGMIDKRPALIAQCSATSDVVACIEFARAESVPVSVRGGGHSFAGKAVCDGGLMIDLSGMKGIEIDTSRRTARAQTGLKLGEFDRETQRHGLVTPLGVMQSLFDPDYPPGRRYYNKAHILRRFESGAIDATLRFAATMPPRPSSIGFQQLHGTAARVSASASAFPHRYDHHVAWISPVEDTAGQDDAMVNWTRECWDALCPHVDRAVYVNALDDAVEEDDLRVRQAYGENYQRLKDLKKQYDPTNLFRQNSNIRPG